MPEDPAPGGTDPARRDAPRGRRGRPGRPGITVLHVVEAIETGCARHLLDVVTHARARHVVAAPATRVGGQTDPRIFGQLVAAGAEVHRVEMRRSTADHRNVAAVGRVRSLARTVGADVVHGHSSIGGVVARLAGLGGGPPVVYTPNGVADGRLAQAVERALGPATAVLVAVSPSERDLVLRRRLVPGDRVALIPNGIDPALPPPAERSLRDVAGVPAGVPLVGSIGRLVDQKAPLDLVTAWASVATAAPDAWFVLIGDGPLADATDRLADDAGIGARYVRLPFLADASAHLADLDVFTLASRFEGAPYVLLEALRAAVPMVATAVVGTVDVLAGGGGTLVPAGDTDALAKAALAVLDGSVGETPPGLPDRHDVTVMGRSYTELYEAVAGGR